MSFRIDSIEAPKCTDLVGFVFVAHCSLLVCWFSLARHSKREAVR